MNIQSPKGRIVLASIALVLGAIILRFDTLVWSTTEEAFHIGQFKAMREYTNSLVLPPVIGWAILACGLLMLAGEITRFVRQFRRPQHRSETAT